MTLELAILLIVGTLVVLAEAYLIPAYVREINRNGRKAEAAAEFDASVEAFRNHLES